MEIVAARLLASPILQEYDAFTVAEVARHPAEFVKPSSEAQFCGNRRSLSEGSEIIKLDGRNPASVQSVEADDTCPRCGIAKWDVLAQLNARLLGISTPHHRQRHAPIAASKTPQPRASNNSSLDKWLTLYRSENIDIRIRAAVALIARSDVPLTIMLDILDSLSDHGLGASIEKALLNRTDVHMLNAMIARLGSTLKRQFAARRNDDANVVRALRTALETPGVSTDNAR